MNKKKSELNKIKKIYEYKEKDNFFNLKTDDIKEFELLKQNFKKNKKCLNLLKNKIKKQRSISFKQTSNI